MSNRLKWKSLRQILFQSNLTIKFLKEFKSKFIGQSFFFIEKFKKFNKAKILKMVLGKDNWINIWILLME